jgi:hypothetical protein
MFELLVDLFVYGVFQQVVVLFNVLLYLGGRCGNATDALFRDARSQVQSLELSGSLVATVNVVSSTPMGSKEFSRANCTGSDESASFCGEVCRSSTNSMPNCWQWPGRLHSG